MAAGAGEWQHGPAPRRLPPYACVPLGVRPRLPGRPNLRQAHLCHSAVPAASCAGRVARGTSGIVRRRRRRLAAGAGEWQHGPAPRRLPPYACVPLGVRPRLPGRPNLRQAHLCHSAVPAASCAGRVARGRDHRAAAATVGGGGASGSTALLPDACRHMSVSLLGCALACQDGQTCARPTCAIQWSQPHRAQAVLRVALVALSGRRRRRLAAAAGEWQHGPAHRRLPPYACVPLGMRPRLPGRPNLRQAHLCHSAVPAASCAGRVARGTSGIVRRWRRRLAAGAGEWQHGPAPRRLPPYACVPLGVRPRLPGRPNLRQAHLCHSVVSAASCAGRVARGTSGHCP